MMTAKVEMKNISLRFGKFEALNDISLTFEAGKIHGLIGRNGAGKTSLLSLLAAFREPTKGQIEIDGEPVFENPEKMQQISFIYEKDYADEYETIPALLEFSERYRPHYDEDDANHFLKRFKLQPEKPPHTITKE